MYLNLQIHDTQDTLTIRVGYIGIHSRISISSPTCGPLLSMMASIHVHSPKPPRYVSRMYPACIPHVSRMYPACILITSEDTCIPHVSRISDTYLSRYIMRYMYLIMYLGCIPHVS